MPTPTRSARIDARIQTAIRDAISYDEVMEREMDTLQAERDALLALVRKVANQRPDGRCESCNAEPAPEGYCGCANSADGTVEAALMREARALLATLDGAQ